MNKSTLIAVVVFAGLAFAAYSTLRQKPERGVSRFSLEQVDADKVDRVLLGDDDGIDLRKSGEHWMIDGVRADDSLVSRVVDSVAQIKTSDLASRNPDRFAKLEVDEDKGARIRVYAGDRELADLVVGSVTGGGSYVRSGEDVYVARGIHRATLTRDRAGWVERRAFFDEVGDVNRVKVALHGEQPYELVKKDDNWQLADASVLGAGQRFDPEAAARLVRSLVTLRAEEVLGEDASGDDAFGADSDHLEYGTTSADEVRVLTLAAGGDDTVKARSSQRERPLSLRKAAVDGLRKKASDLRDWKIVSFDRDEAKRLEIRDGATTLDLEKKDDGSWAVAESSEPVADDFALDSTVVTRRLAALTRLAAVAESDGAGLDVAAASSRISVVLDDDSKVTLAFGDESQWQERSVYSAVGNVDAKTYLVGADGRDRMLAGLESFRRREAPPGGMGGLGGLDPAALQNLPPEVRESLLKQMAEQRQREAVMKQLTGE